MDSVAGTERFVVRLKGQSAASSPCGTAGRGPYRELANQETDVNLGTALNEMFEMNVGAARRVDQPVAYLARTAAGKISARVGGKAVEGTYTMDGAQFQIRHGTTMDAFTFKEIFVRQAYAVPEQVRDRLPKRPLRVLDLGGNIGLFGLWASRTLPVDRIIAVEADPDNASIYRRLIHANGFDWTLVEACAAASEGTVMFATGSENAGAIAEDGDGTPVPSVDVLPLMQDADLTKIDIEGAEWMLF